LAKERLFAGGAGIFAPDLPGMEPGHMADNFYRKDEVFRRGLWIMQAKTTLDRVVFESIGFVSNSFNKPGDPKALRNSQSLLILDEKYIGAMDGLERYRYLLVIFQFHRSAGYRERVHPMGDRSIPERGVLATRSPCRPNPIGVTVAELISVEGNTIRVTGLDALNGTPILAIKPYEEHFDSEVGIERERAPNYKPEDRR
jgi:tRNA-Thr(GGU) m(6)t(6)A37 methyltransferase TsaA